MAMYQKACLFSGIGLWLWLWLWLRLAQRPEWREEGGGWMMVGRGFGIINAWEPFSGWHVFKHRFSSYLASPRKVSATYYFDRPGQSANKTMVSKNLKNLKENNGFPSSVFGRVKPGSVQDWEIRESKKAKIQGMQKNENKASKTKCVLIIFGDLSLRRTVLAAPDGV